MKMDEIVDVLRIIQLYYEDTEQRRAQWEETRQKNLNQADLIRAMAQRNDKLRARVNYLEMVMAKDKSMAQRDDELRARNHRLEQAVSEVRAMADQLWLLQYMVLDGMTDLPLRLIKLFGNYQNPLMAFLLYSETHKIKGIGSYYSGITLTSKRKFEAKINSDYLQRLKNALTLIPPNQEDKEETDGKRQAQ